MLYSYEAKDREGRTVTGSIEAADERSAARQVHEIGYYLMRLAPIAGQPAAAAYPGANGAGYPQAAPYPQSGSYSNTVSPESTTYPPYASPSPYEQAPASAILPEPPQGRSIFDRRPLTLGRWLMENFFLRLWTGVSAGDLAMFYRSFAALIDAGVPLKQSFDALGAQTPNFRVRAIIRRMWQVVESGGQISDAMSEYPWLFRIDHIALVKAGEASGNLDRMFLRIASGLEMEDSIKKNVVKETTLPIVTLGGVFLLPKIYLVVVCGKVHEYLDVAVWPLVDIVAVAFAVWVFSKLTTHVRYVRDAVVAHIPAVAKPVRMLALAQFARTLSSLYSSGVSVPTSVRCSAEACGNAFIGQRLLSAIPLMESGYSIVDAIGRTHALPPIVMSMLGVGETTGSIDRMMDKVADHFEQEAMVALHQLMTAIRVISTILIGIRVLMELIQFYSAYFGGILSGNGGSPCGSGPMTGPLGHMGPTDGGSGGGDLDMGN